MNMEKRINDAYVCPAVEFIDVCSEGVLCESIGQLEDVLENQGSWGSVVGVVDLLG